jgi:hypothetical protein
VNIGGEKNVLNLLHMRTFHIQYQRKNLKVTEEEENHFSVVVPGRRLHLLLKQDNEGANHWFEEGKDKETVETSEVGLAIESYLNKA